jgi:hypothetical protein
VVKPLSLPPWSSRSRSHPTAIFVVAVLRPSSSSQSSTHLCRRGPPPVFVFVFVIAILCPYSSSPSSAHPRHHPPPVFAAVPPVFVVAVHLSSSLLSSAGLRHCRPPLFFIVAALHRSSLWPVFVIAILHPSSSSRSSSRGRLHCRHHRHSRMAILLSPLSSHGHLCHHRRHPTVIFVVAVVVPQPSSTLSPSPSSLLSLSLPSLSRGCRHRCPNTCTHRFT